MRGQQQRRKGLAATVLFFEALICVGSIEINARCVGIGGTMRRGDAPSIESKSRCDHASRPRLREMGSQLRFPVSISQRYNVVTLGSRIEAKPTSDLFWVERRTFCLLTIKYRLGCR